MDTTKIIAVLFDFDGVIMDTETQYTVFWDEQGHKYLGEEDFGRCIKGQTLTQIYEKYFSDKPEAQEEITARLNLFEKAMSYKYIPGVEGMVDRILTGEMFAHSKPAPDCFLLGMEVFSATPENTYVFEDSFHGLQAGMTSGATVIGLATTNTRKAITGKAHYIIDDFAEMTYEKLLTMQR